MLGFTKTWEITVAEEKQIYSKLALRKMETFSISNLHLEGLWGTNSFYNRRRGSIGQKAGNRHVDSVRLY